jgi:uncharacterized protein YbaR (Trm112 family)
MVATPRNRHPKNLVFGVGCQQSSQSAQQMLHAGVNSGVSLVCHPDRRVYRVDEDLAATDISIDEATSWTLASAARLMASEREFAVVRAA